MSDEMSEESSCADSLRTLKANHLRAWFESACRARDAVRRGPAALRACATSAGMSEQTLRRWAFAAVRFAAADIETLANWMDTQGHGLSVWHVVALARLSPRSRHEVLEAMRPLVWPLVKLRNIVRSRKYLSGTDPLVSPVSD